MAVEIARIRRAFVLGAALTLAVVGGTAWKVVDDLRQAEADFLKRILLATYDANRNVHIVLEAARTTLEDIRGYVDVEEDRIVTSGRIDAAIDRTLSRNAFLTGAIVQDRTGRVVAAGYPRIGLGADLSGLDFFTLLMRDQHTHFELGAPFHSAVFGRTLIPFARAIVDDEGGRIGVISVGIDLSALREAIAPRIAGHDARMLLWRDDGLLLASATADHIAAGRTYPDLPLFKQRIRDGVAGTFQAFSPQMGKTHLAAWHNNSVFPAFLSAGVARDDALKDDNAKALFLSLGVLGALAFYWFSIVRIARERLRAETALRSAENSLDLANRSLEAKSRFLANMSHELRTPLNGIIGYTDMLRAGLMGEVPPRQVPAISNVSQAAGRLAELVEKLLELSQLETGAQRLEWESVKLDDALGEAAAAVKALAATRSVSLSLPDPSAAIGLRCDRKRTRQILVNLLENAVRHAKSGGGVEVRTSETKEGFVRIDILDDGDGFGGGPLEKYLDVFSGRNAYVASADGIGLGLPLSRHWARAQGGDLWIANRPEGGATVSLVLPAPSRGARIAA